MHLRPRPARTNVVEAGRDVLRGRIRVERLRPPRDSVSTICLKLVKTESRIYNGVAWRDVSDVVGMSREYAPDCLGLECTSGSLLCGSLSLSLSLSLSRSYNALQKHSAVGQRP